MQTIRVVRDVRYHVDDVFAKLADHAAYASLPLVQTAALVRAGVPDINGVGAVRHVQVRQVLFIENIVAYEPPYRLGYRVRSCRLQLPFAFARVTIPFEHVLGEIRLAPVHGGTTICWESRFRVPVFMGHWVEPLLAEQGRQAFENILIQMFPE